MSQYRANLPNNRLLIYGYDRMLNEYFISVIDVSDPKEDREEFAIGSNMNTTAEHPEFPGKMTWSNSELYEILKRYTGFIPMTHLQALLLDIPF